MPTLIIIAGPNGAGKTTFAREYLSAEQRHFEFVNADEIARMREGRDTQVSDVGAARIMLSRIDELAEAGADFVIETTLANLSYAPKILSWRRRGYLVSLVYLRLDSVNDSVARIRRRVVAGGHGIPEDTIRRRFGKSLRYFDTIYRPIVDEWYVWASGEGAFDLIGSWDGRHEKRL
ncbi:MAG: zeta toxin family protein [Bradyrhizobiaceae bacterium]|nr:zeta toxin family protein [Bradyrhizobiaceae bacterium]